MSVVLKGGKEVPFGPMIFEVGCLFKANPNFIEELTIDPKNPEELKYQIQPPSVNRPECAIRRHLIDEQRVNDIPTTTAVTWDDSCRTEACLLIKILNTDPECLIKFDMVFVVSETQKFRQAVRISVGKCLPSSTAI